MQTTKPNDAIGMIVFSQSGISKGATEQINHGLTKREHFAAMALNGILSTNGSYFPDTQNTGDLAAVASVKYADALIKALNEGKEDAK